MNNISNFELSKLNGTLVIIAGSLEEIASSLSSIDDGIKLLGPTPPAGTYSGELQQRKEVENE